MASQEAWRVYTGALYPLSYLAHLCETARVGFEPTSSLVGGFCGSRSHDLLHVEQALYQLS